MNFEGKLVAPKKNEKYWEVSIPDLGVFTQGKNQKNAYLMAADALETLADKKNFKVTVTPTRGNRFLITANDPTFLVARWLQCLRIKNKLTVRELSSRLGSKSPRAWARYESGDVSPTIDKLYQLLKVVDPDGKFALKRFR